MFELLSKILDEFGDRHPFNTSPLGPPVEDQLSMPQLVLRD
jgi:hypothetical protein